MSDTENQGNHYGYALVRDANGNPKFDNWDDAYHPGYRELLTDADMAYIEEKRNDSRTRSSNP